MLDEVSNARYLVAQCQHGDRRGCRGTGRTLKMLKNMGLGDVAVFTDDISKKNAIAMAEHFDLLLGPENFKVIPVHESMIVRALVGRADLRTHHLDHHWLDVFYNRPKSKSKSGYKPLNPSKIGVSPRQLGISKSGLSNKTGPQIAQALRKGASRLFTIADKIESGELEL